MRRRVVSCLVLSVIFATPLMAASCLPQNNTAINYGFTSGGPLVANLPIGVRAGSQIVASPTHVYYVGSDHRIYDNLWNGTSWQGGTWPLNFGGPLVRAGSAIVNDGDTLYYVGTDHRIYQLRWTVNVGWQTQLLVPSQALVRNGTDIVFHKSHIYYVDPQNKICDLFFNGSVWSGGQRLIWSSTVGVKANTQIVVTDAHVYYIGTDDRVYDHFWNGTTWSGGNWPLLPGSTKVKPGTRLTNDVEHLFYVGVNDKVHELIWMGNQWTGGAVWTPTASDPVRSGTDLVHLDSHIYYVSAISNRVYNLVWDAGTGWSASVLDATSVPVQSNTQLFAWFNEIFEEGSATDIFHSHHVFYTGNDSRIHFLIWDDVRPTYRGFACLDPTDMNGDGHGYQDPNQGFALAGDDCNACKSNGAFPKTWYYGRLNSNASPIRAGGTLARSGKQFFFVSSNDRVHAFRRGVVNSMAKPNWTLSFNDEFTTALDPTKWQTEFPWGNHPPDICYDFYWNDAQNVQVSGGELHLKGERLGIPVSRTNNVTWPVISYTKNYSYQTGMIDSEALFSQTYGYYEARARIPRGRYFWPSFWTAGKGGEIDVFEAEGNGKTLIGTPQFTTGWVPSVTAYAIGYRLYDDFYTFGMEWNSGKFTWYLNNEPIGSIANPDIGGINGPLGALATLEMHDAHGACEIENLPATFDIDYVRVYR